ncbi:tRNA intron endonuclease, partial [Ostertagia ostertagi]
ERSLQRTLTIATENQNDVGSRSGREQIDYITIDYVSDQFFIFSEQEAMWLREELHIIPRSAMSTEVEAPYLIAPEQVVLLVQHGYGKVRVQKDPLPCTSNQTACLEGEGSSVNEKKRAGVDAVERKAKTLERSTQGLGCCAEKGKVSLQVDPDENIYRWLDEFEVPVPCTREFRARQLVYYDLWSRGYYLTSGEQFGTAWLVYEGPPDEVHATFLVDPVFEDQMIAPTNLIALVRVAVQVKKLLVLAVVSPDRTQPHYVMMDWLRPRVLDEE